MIRNEIEVLPICFFSIDPWISLSHNRRGQNFGTHTSFVSLSVSFISKALQLYFLEFFGANIVDDTPFIVMPLLKNGNALGFVLANPTCGRVKIVWSPSILIPGFYEHDPSSTVARRLSWPSSPTLPAYHSWRPKSCSSVSRTFLYGINVFLD